MDEGAIAELVIRRDLGAAFPQIRIYESASAYEEEIAESRKDFPKEFRRPRAVIAMPSRSSIDVFMQLEAMIESEQLTAGLSSTWSSPRGSIDLHTLYCKQKKVGEIEQALANLGGQPYQRKK